MSFEFLVLSFELLAPFGRRDSPTFPEARLGHRPSPAILHPDLGKTQNSKLITQNWWRSLRP
jgi:hypothetical protein